MAIEIRPVHASLVAEPLGLDIAPDLGAATVAARETAWTRHGIRLVRHLRLTPARQVGRETSR